MRITAKTSAQESPRKLNCSPSCWGSRTRMSPRQLAASCRQTRKPLQKRDRPSQVVPFATLGLRPSWIHGGALSMQQRRGRGHDRVKINLKFLTAALHRTHTTVKSSGKISNVNSLHRFHTVDTRLLQM